MLFRSFNGDALESAIGNDEAVSAHQPKQTAMKLISAAFIVAINQNDLWPNLVLFPGLKMFSPSKPDNVFLKAATGFSANPLPPNSAINERTLQTTVSAVG